MPGDEKDLEELDEMSLDEDSGYENSKVPQKHPNIFSNDKSNMSLN